MVLAKEYRSFLAVVIGGFAVIFVRANPVRPLRFGFYVLPFLILFLLPNLVLFAPWNWDNIKILIYWFSVRHPWRRLL